MKHYTFSDCVSYAQSHNIAFNFYYTDDFHSMHYIYCDISDGDDGYLTATQAIFEYNNFNKKYEATMNLNIRYAYKKDYEFMRRMCIAINEHRTETLSHCKAYSWQHGVSHWYGALCLNNEHYIAASKLHGNDVWNM